MSALLAGLAGLLLLWPQARPAARLRGLAGRVGRPRCLPGAPVLVAAGACVTVFVVVGPAATIAAGIAAATICHRMALQRRAAELTAGPLPLRPVSTTKCAPPVRADSARP